MKLQRDDAILKSIKKLMNFYLSGGVVMISPCAHYKGIINRNTNDVIDSLFFNFIILFNVSW